MARQIRFLLIAAGVFTALASLVIFISSDKKAAKEAQLQKNLRAAKFGGALDPEHAPQAKFSEQTLDLGIVGPLDQVQRSLRVRNNGGAPLKVNVQERGCDCVAVSVEDEKIFAGQSGVIQFTFTAPEKEQAFDHAVQLSTNDPLQKQVTINITGTIRRTAWTEPRELDFAGLLPNEAREGELRVFSAWEEGCEVSGLGGLPRGVEVMQEPLDQDELEAAGAKSGRLLRIRFPAAWQGKVATPLTFDVVRAGSNESIPKSVHFRASRLGRISLSHERLNTLGQFEIGNIAYGTGRQFTLFLAARGANKQLQLARVEAAPAFLQASLEPGVNVATSGLHRLKFEIPPDAPEGSYAGEQQGSLTLHFDDPEYPAVTFHPTFHITRE